MNTVNYARKRKLMIRKAYPRRIKRLESNKSLTHIKFIIYFMCFGKTIKKLFNVLEKNVNFHSITYKERIEENSYLHEDFQAFKDLESEYLVLYNNISKVQFRVELSRIILKKEVWYFIINSVILVFSRKRVFFIVSKLYFLVFGFLDFILNSISVLLSKKESFEDKKKYIFSLLFDLIDFMLYSYMLSFVFRFILELLNSIDQTRLTEFTNIVDEGETSNENKGNKAYKTLINISKYLAIIAIIYCVTIKTSTDKTGSTLPKREEVKGKKSKRTSSQLEKDSNNSNNLPHTPIYITSPWPSGSPTINYPVDCGKFNPNSPEDRRKMENSRVCIKVVMSTIVALLIGPFGCEVTAIVTGERRSVLTDLTHWLLDVEV